MMWTDAGAGAAATGHNGRVLVAEVAEVSRAVAGAAGRLAKIAAIAAALQSAAPDEVPIVVAYLSGELPQRQIGVGWAALRSAPPASIAPSLTVLGVDASFSEIGAVVGPGSVAERKRLVDDVMSAATIDEQYFLVRLLSGELRQGALDGVMTEAVARAAAVPAALVRRAVMLRGSLPAVAEAALDGGADALSEFGLLVGQPLKPMLASSAPSVEAALGKIAVDAAKAGAGSGRAGAATAPSATRRVRRGRVRRQRWSGSWTAFGSRPISRVATFGCSPGRSTTSPRGCPRWSPHSRSCR